MAKIHLNTLYGKTTEERAALVASALSKLTIAEYEAVANHVVTSFLVDVHQATDEEMIALLVLASADVPTSVPMHTNPDLRAMGVADHPTADCRVGVCGLMPR